MKRKIMMIGIVLILIIESVFIYNLFKPNKSLILENVKKVDVFNNKNKALSIMIQDENFEYQPAPDRSKWPDYTEYMYVGTDCEDASGNNITDTSQYIQFEETSPNPTVTITTKKTIYCTLYFGKGRPVLEVLDAKGGTYYGGGKQGSRRAVDGLYRFNGTYEQVTNNYICLGPENPDKCVDTAEHKRQYLYRIIGVTDGSQTNTKLGLKEGMLKVIMASNTRTGMWCSGDYGCTWESSSLITNLNNTFYNSIDGRVKKEIQSVLWYVGDVNKSGEKSELSKKKYNIGLMYRSDYSYAGVSSTQNWLYHSHGLSVNSASSQDEWTMTREGYWDEGVGWIVGYIVDGHSGSTQYHDGDGVTGALNRTNIIRPTFYLSDNLGLYGEGTEQHPYTITTIK